jgi:hypothetical protein
MSDISESVGQQLQNQERDARAAAAATQLRHLEDLKHVSDQED